MLKKFSGVGHPPENEYLLKNKKIKTAKIQKKVLIPAYQHAHCAVSVQRNVLG